MTPTPPLLYRRRLRSGERATARRRWAWRTGWPSTRRRGRGRIRACTSTPRRARVGAGARKRQARAQLLLLHGHGGVAAAAGGARSVTNVDFSPSALGVGRVNVRLNGEQFQALGQRLRGRLLRAALDGRQETLTSALKAWRDESEDEDGGGGEDDGVTVASVAYEGSSCCAPTCFPRCGSSEAAAGGRRTKQQANNNNGGGRGGRGGWRGGGGGGRGSGGRHGGRGGGGRGGKSRAALYFPAQTFDLVVLDPPTFSSSPFGAVDIVRDYQSLLKPAALATAPGGGALLVTNHVSGVDLEAWLDQCERCCAKAGRPLAAPPEVLEPHADFPPMDDRRHPLKIAVLRV